ncbi:hypothetical protein [Pedobacter sp.]|uniref:hypothetical protein n=1 Tax=Pedobacter sp. TaxID=1411316 RepID=UPI003D7FF906
MVKNKYIYLLSLLLTLVVACGTKENIQRDLVVTTSAIAFDIPISSDITDTLALATLKTPTDLNQVISEGAPGFTLADLKSIRVSGFAIEIPGQEEVEAGEEEDLTNTLKAFESIKLKVQKTDNKLIELGVINNSAMQASDAISLPIARMEEVNQEINAGTLTYVISGLRRTPTTKLIKAQCYIQYKLTLGM